MDEVAQRPASITLAAPWYEPLAVVMPTSGRPEEAYPFAHIVGRNKPEAQLQSWLRTGARVRAGGAVLVTGFRGSGKTTLVNKVLFDVALHELHGVPLGEPVAGCWGPLEVLEPRVRNPSTPRTMLIPVRINVGYAISADALFHRIVRQLYLAMVNHGVGHWQPGLIRRARLAWLRCLGSVEHQLADKVSEKIGISLDQLGKLEFTAAQEVEIASSMTVLAGRLTAEEAEDELLALSDGLGAGVVDEGLGVAQAPSALAAGFKRFISQLSGDTRDAVQGRAGLRIHPVLVLDELDKLSLPEAGPVPSAGQVSLAWGAESVGGRQVLEGNLGMPAGGETKDALRSALQVVQRLKTLFASQSLSAIVIGGQALADAWAAEQDDEDPMLGSIFSRVVHVSAASRDDLILLCKTHKVPETRVHGVAAHLLMESRGRYKTALRMLAQWQAAEWPALDACRWAAQMAPPSASDRLAASVGGAGAPEGGDPSRGIGSVRAPVDALRDQLIGCWRDDVGSRDWLEDRAQAMVIALLCLARHDWPTDKRTELQSHWVKTLSTFAPNPAPLHVFFEEAFRAASERPGTPPPPSP
jgi:AAA ATPase domain